MGYAITYCPAYEKLSRFLTQYGEGSMAFSSFQPNMKYFIDEDLGYLPFLYLQHFLFAPKGMNVIIGDPICSSGSFEQLFERYLQSSSEQATAFIHLSEHYARELSRRGYFVNEMGVEHLIKLPDFDVGLPGAKYAHIRRWRNKAQKSGVEVREQAFADVPVEAIEKVNRYWLGNKGGVEFIGLMRPLRIEDKADVRYFWAYHENQLIGFACFDPMYSEGKVTGYIHNIARLLPEAPHGTNDLIILEAIKTFKAEGIEDYTLGLSPFANLTDGELPHRASFKRIFKFMHNHCQFVYPFKGNYFHKEKYRAEQKKIYLALLPNSNLYRLLGIFKALNLI
tara:strand:+ start:6343 stop:7356 length:1014 start_codon:yes stop_codon:yes gene_type:complete